MSLAERGALGGMPVADMIRRALAFLIREGPSSPQDRCEEDAGVNPYTLAVCIAALMAGVDLLPECELPLRQISGMPAWRTGVWRATLN